jgi:hypothetical protein
MSSMSYSTLQNVILLLDQLIEIYWLVCNKHIDIKDWNEEIKDTKGVIKIHKSAKDK